MYNIKEVPNFTCVHGEGGATSYNFSTNAVSIEFNGEWASLAHELKHAYQFEVGELSFSRIKGQLGYLYDIEDEYTAHLRGAAYDINQYSSRGQIANRYRFKTVDERYYYPFLETIPYTAPKNSLPGGRTFSRTSSENDLENKKCRYLLDEAYRKYIPQDKRFKTVK